MSTTAPNPAVTAIQENAQIALTLEQKIEQAAEEASQVAAIFSPQVGQAIQAGVAVEPVVAGFIQMLIGLFKHHTKQVPPPVQ